MTYRTALAAILAAAALALAATPAGAQSASCTSGSASGPIVLDGQFGDWGGRPCVPDAREDCQNSALDISSVSFATNPNDGTAYFMVARSEDRTAPLNLVVMIDVDDNGSYTDAVDRRVVVQYRARKNDSRVDVILTTASGVPLAVIATAADLGESLDEGGRQVEFGVPLAQLGITAGQAIRFVVTSSPGVGAGGKPCDTTSEVQWSPADALGIPLLIVGVLGAAGLLAWRRRRQ
jgi:hypothetical protein